MSVLTILIVLVVVGLLLWLVNTYIPMDGKNQANSQHCYSNCSYTLVT